MYFQKAVIRKVVAVTICVALVIVNFLAMDFAIPGWHNTNMPDFVSMLSRQITNIVLAGQFVLTLLSFSGIISSAYQIRWMPKINMLVAVLTIIFWILSIYGSWLYLGFEGVLQQFAFYSRVFGHYFWLFFAPWIISQLFWVRPIRKSTYMTLILCFLISLNNWWMIFFQ